MLFDQLLITHPIENKIADAELVGDIDPACRDDATDESQGADHGSERHAPLTTLFSNKVRADGYPKA